MFGYFLPRETSFFDYFEQLAALAVRCAKEFLALTQIRIDSEGSRRIKDIEHEADSLAHTCLEALHRTFITPIERDDILKLITKMDDILDCLDAAARRLALYELKEPNGGLRSMAEVALKSAEAVERAVRGLRNMKNSKAVLEECVYINQLENEEDAIYADAVASLFKNETDPMTVFKWKEVYEAVESAADSCEDVANIIEGIVLECA